MRDRFPYPVVVVLVAIILTCKSPDAFIFPDLHCEDGRDLFAAFYDPDARQIVRPFGKMPYLALGSTGFAYLASFLPIQIVPHAYAGFALLLASLAIAFFAHRSLGGVLPDQRVRMFAVVVISILPLAPFAMFSMVAYSQFHLLLLMILLSISRLPTRRAPRFAKALLISILAWCHPLSVLLVPVLGVRFWSSSQRDWMLALPVLSSCAYLVAGISLQSTTPAWSFLEKLPQIAVERVVFEGLFGTTLRMSMRDAGWLSAMQISGALLLAGVVAIVAFKERGRKEKSAWCLVYLLFALLAVSIVVRPHKDILEIPWAQRHLYLPRVLFLLLLVTAAYSLRQTVTVRSAARWVLAGLAVGLALSVSGSNRFLLTSDRNAGLELRQFLREVATLEARAADCREVYSVTLARAAWDIPLLVGHPDGVGKAISLDSGARARLARGSGCARDEPPQGGPSRTRALDLRRPGPTTGTELAGAAM